MGAKKEKQSLLSRRNLLRLASVAVASATSVSTAKAEAKCINEKEKTVSEHTDEVEQERHHIFLLLAASLVHWRWRIFKSSKTVRAEYQNKFPNRKFGEYIGHNIGALAVNGRREVVGFQMNEATYLNSSLEHAELRCIRDAINAENKRRFVGGRSNAGYAVMLQGYTVYTTLEPCSQCAGAMDLANVDKVVYLQKDPVQRGICNILHELHGNQNGKGAPLPLFADQTNASHNISKTYDEWFEAQKANGGRIGLTAFLEDIQTYELFERMFDEFKSYTVTHSLNQSIYDHALEYYYANRN